MRGFGNSLDRLAALTVAGLQLGLWAGPAAAQVVADDLVCAGCVQATDIANGTIGPNKLIPGSINAATIANGVIGPNKLIPGSINTSVIATDAIRSNKILDGSVTSADIADGTINLGDLTPAVQQIIADLQAKVAAMEALFAVVAVEDVATDLNGDGFIDDSPVDLDGDGLPDADSEFLPTVIFEGVNLQIVNGHPSERTQSLNALGNLIVGYNEARPNFSSRFCSDGRFPDNEPVTGCEANGHIWADNHKSGSHNLVVGAENSYSRAGGVVFGEKSRINAPSATVTGGWRNRATGTYASVSGGENGRATGRYSVISGGTGSTASARSSVVIGGLSNRASGDFSTVGGGSDSTASGDTSVVIGGDDNAASGVSAVVIGGDDNIASGDSPVVIGGFKNTASGDSSVVSGGNGVIIPGNCNWGGEGAVFGNGVC